MNPILKTILKIRARVLYARAVRQADALCAANGARQYVLAHADGRRRTLIIVDRRTFRMLKRARRLPLDASVADLERDAIYHTPHPDGKGRLLPHWARLRRAQWIESYAT